MRLASTSQAAETMSRVWRRQPAASRKISGRMIHSISHGPVERSWSATPASSSDATFWRTTAALAWM